MIVRLPLTISNAYLIRGELPLLVDTGSPGDFISLQKQLLSHKVSIEELVLIVHTHAHRDHAGSTLKIKEKADIPTIVHSNDLASLEKGVNAPGSPRGCTAIFSRWFFPGRYPGVNPEMIFDTELDLSPFGLEARLVHTPGHTAGSCSLVLANGEAVVGDLLRGGLLGGYLFPGKPGFPYFISDKTDLLESVKKLLDMGMKKFHVGHGGVLERGKVEKWWEGVSRPST